MHVNKIIFLSILGFLLTGFVLMAAEELLISGETLRERFPDGGARLKWDAAPERAVELGLYRISPDIPEFDRAEIILNVRFPEAVRVRRILLRLVDRTGEIFQFYGSATGELPPGETALRYPIDAAAPDASIWAGNGDRKIDWPLRISVVAVDPGKELPAGEFLIESVVMRRAGENCRIDFTAGNEFNLLLPEHRENPFFTVSNTGDETANLKGCVKLSGQEGLIRTRKVDIQVAPGEEIRIPLEGNFDEQGSFLVEYSFEGRRTYRGEHRFGRMIPAGPTPGREEGFLFGLCGHPERVTPEAAAKEAQLVGLCGAKILRLDFSWSRIQPEPGKWDFSIFDRLVEEFGRNGVELQCLLGYSVPWAVAADFQPKDPSRKGIPALPDCELYGAYAAAVAERYRERIRYFEIWNEPDIVSFANFPGEKYMELLRAGYAAVKRAAPEAIVMNGGIGSAYTNDIPHPGNNNGVLDLLLADGGKHFDLFAFHSHGNLARYRDELRILREKGLISAQNSYRWYSNETADTYTTPGGEYLQAETLMKKLLYAWSAGAIGYNWYLLREKDIYPVGHPERHFGLVTAQFEPKPAYITYNMLASNYRGACFRGTFAPQSGIDAFLFELPDGSGLLSLWSESGERIVCLSGVVPGTVKIDLYGNESKLPCRNSELILKVGRTPFSLKMPAFTDSLNFLSSNLLPELPLQLTLKRGVSTEFSIPVSNPTREKLDVTMTAVATSEAVWVVPEEACVTVAPGETRQLTFQLEAGDAFETSGALDLSVAFGEYLTDKRRIALARGLERGKPLFVLNSREQFHSLIPSAPGNEVHYWQGPEDLSGKLYLSIQDDALQIRAEIQDDRHVQPFSGSNVWRGDNIQLGIRLPEQECLWKIGLTRLADGTSEVFCWMHPSTLPDPSGAIRLETARDETKKMTSYHAEIPFAALGTTAAAIHRGIRFNAMVNENDGELRKGFLYGAPGLGVSDNDALWPVVNPPESGAETK